MRQQFRAPDSSKLIVLDGHEGGLADRKLRVAFAVRDVGPKTGVRAVSNIQEIQSTNSFLLYSHSNFPCSYIFTYLSIFLACFGNTFMSGLLLKTQRIKATIENITFEHLDVGSTVRYMAGVHIFISVHGAGMTNTVSRILYRLLLANCSL